MQRTENRGQGAGAISKSLLIVMTLTVIGKVSGFVREMFMSNKYGLTPVADAIKKALDIPAFFLSAIVIAMAATYIPVYSGRQQHGRDQADRFSSNLLTVGSVFTVLLLLVTLLFLEPLVKVFFLAGAAAETQEMAITLTRMMMPMGLFMFLTRIATAHLQANFRFTIPAISQIFYNIILIAAILIAAKGDATFVAIGAVAGWLLQFLVMVPSLRRTGLRYRPVWDLSESGLRQVLVLMVPVLVSGAFDTLYMGFDGSIASQVSGDIASLDYANRLTSMVGAILPMTIATVLYPSLVRHVDDPGQMTGDLCFGVNINLLIAIPASVSLILLSGPITRLVYERGSFTAENTLSTAPLLACYAAGIFGIGLRELCNRCFYAYKDVTIPTIVGVFVILLKIGLNYVLYPLLGAPGLAAATSASWLLSGVVLLFLLHLRRHVIDWRTILRCLWKVAAATAAMSATLLALFAGLGLKTLGGARFPLFMATVMLAGLLVYVAVLALLRSEELRTAMAVLKQRLKRE